MTISIADIFVAQSHLVVDDPDGPYTCGSPEETVEWMEQHLIGMSQVPRQGDQPAHTILMIRDGSGVAVVVEGETLRIAADSGLDDEPDWSEAGDAWVRIGGQPGATQYREALDRIIGLAPGGPEERDEEE